MKNEIREKLKIYQGKTILSIGYGETDNQGRGKGYFKITFTDKSQIEILPDLFGVSLEVNFRN
jgi:hypothetical protein